MDVYDEMGDFLELALQTRSNSYHCLIVSLIEEKVPDTMYSE
jgi:hypothetical protein